jgi:hypothetical protein
MRPGRTVSGIVLTGVDGTPIDLARYEGRRYVMFVWASW